MNSNKIRKGIYGSVDHSVNSSVRRSVWNSVEDCLWFSVFNSVQVSVNETTGSSDNLVNDFLERYES